MTALETAHDHTVELAPVRGRSRISTSAKSTMPMVQPAWNTRSTGARIMITLRSNDSSS